MWRKLLGNFPKSIASITLLSGALGYETIVDHSPSNYQAACNNLGFKSSAQQGALLNVLNMAGYFQQSKLWEQIYRSKIFTDPQKTFVDTTSLMRKFGANSAEAKDFNAQEASKEWFGRSLPHLWELFDSGRVTADQVAHMITYFGQTAFDRRAYQERSELNDRQWMQKHKKDYMEAARDLGLIDPILPDLDLEYDGTLVLGASRAGVYARLVELNHYIKKWDVETGPIYVLAGERPLWAEIDGISPDVFDILLNAKINNLSMDETNTYVPSASSESRTKEGCDYIKALANREGILLNPDNPIIQIKGRHYANYQDESGGRLTETTMTGDLLQGFELQATILDTKADKDKGRPDTHSTAQDHAKLFIDGIKSGEHTSVDNVFYLMSLSNNPYTTRQAITVQRAFNEELKKQGLDKDYKVIIDGVGFGCKQDVSTIHSEFGALLSEMFKDTFPDADTSNIMFRTRDNDSEVPAMPVVGEVFDNDFMNAS